MTIDKVMNNLYDALSKNQDTIWFDYQGFRWELGHDLSFIHDIYFIQEIALKIDVQLNTVVQSPTIQNQKTNIYARAYYDRQNE